MSSNPMANCVNETAMPKNQDSKVTVTMAKFVADLAMLRLDRIVESAEFSRPFLVIDGTWRETHTEENEVISDFVAGGGAPTTSHVHSHLPRWQ